MNNYRKPKPVKNNPIPKPLRLLDTSVDKAKTDKELKRLKDLDKHKSKTIESMKMNLENVRRGERNPLRTGHLPPIESIEHEQENTPIQFIGNKQMNLKQNQKNNRPI